MSFPTLSLTNVEKIRKSKSLFAPVSFVLHASEGLAVQGHNGCGKTTLLDCIAGVEKATNGKIEIAGRLGYAMQRPGFQANLSCLDNLLIEGALSGMRGKELRASVLHTADACGCSEYLKKAYYKCSAGMQARISLAAAVIKKPQLLLLDEPFSALDEQSYQFFRKFLFGLKEEGTSLLLVSHNSADFHGLCERMLHLPQAEVTLI